MIHTSYVVCSFLCVLFLQVGSKHVMILYLFRVQRENFQCNSHVSDGFPYKLYHLSWLVTCFCHWFFFGMIIIYNPKAHQWRTMALNSGRNILSWARSHIRFVIVPWRVAPFTHGWTNFRDATISRWAKLMPRLEGILQGGKLWKLWKHHRVFWVVVTQRFLEFSPRSLGKWSNLTNIFQMGWNHQLVFDGRCF